MTAAVFGDRVQETFTTTGTGTISLAGPVTGYQAFGAVLTSGQTCYYAATDGTQWEVGLGTYTLSGDTIARTEILASSNGGAAVTWLAGTKSIWLDFPAYLANQVANPNVVTSPGGTPTGTTDTVPTQMGVAATFAPQFTGTLLVVFTGYLGQSGTGGANTFIDYGTGTPPSNGELQSTANGIQIGGYQTFNTGVSGEVPFSCTGLITGLTPGTTYWFDLCLYRLAANGTATVGNVQVTIVELK